MEKKRKDEKPKRDQRERREGEGRPAKVKEKFGGKSLALERSYRREVEESRREGGSLE